MCKIRKKLFFGQVTFKFQEAPLCKSKEWSYCKPLVCWSLYREVHLEITCRKVLRHTILRFFSMTWVWFLIPYPVTPHKKSCPTCRCSCLPCFLIFSQIKGCCHWILAWTHVSLGLRRGRGCFVFGSGRRQSDKGAPLRGTRTATQYQQQVWTLLNSGPGFHLALLGYISFLDGRQMN